MIPTYEQVLTMDYITAVVVETPRPVTWPGCTNLQKTALCRVKGGIIAHGGQRIVFLEHKARRLAVDYDDIAAGRVAFGSMAARWRTLTDTLTDAMANVQATIDRANEAIRKAYQTQARCWLRSAYVATLNSSMHSRIFQAYMDANGQKAAHVTWKRRPGFIDPRIDAYAAPVVRPDEIRTIREMVMPASSARKPAGIIKSAKPGAVWYGFHSPARRVGKTLARFLAVDDPGVFLPGELVTLAAGESLEVAPVYSFAQIPRPETAVLPDGARGWRIRPLVRQADLKPGPEWRDWINGQLGQVFGEGR